MGNAHINRSEKLGNFFALTLLNQLPGGQLTKNMELVECRTTPQQVPL